MNRNLLILVFVILGSVRGQESPQANSETQSISLVKYYFPIVEIVHITTGNEKIGIPLVFVNGTKNPFKKKDRDELVAVLDELGSIGCELVSANTGVPVTRAAAAVSSLPQVQLMFFRCKTK